MRKRSRNPNRRFRSWWNPFSKKTEVSRASGTYGKARAASRDKWRERAVSNNDFADFKKELDTRRTSWYRAHGGGYELEKNHTDAAKKVDAFSKTLQEDGKVARKAIKDYVEGCDTVGERMADNSPCTKTLAEEAQTALTKFEGREGEAADDRKTAYGGLTAAKVALDALKKPKWVKGCGMPGCLKRDWKKAGWAPSTDGVNTYQESMGGTVWPPKVSEGDAAADLDPAAATTVKAAAAKTDALDPAANPAADPAALDSS